MDNRSSWPKRYHDREEYVILLWNGGDALLIDGRYRIQSIRVIGTDYGKDALLEWAAQNQVRCVGFEGDSRPPRRSFHRVSWAVEG